MAPVVSIQQLSKVYKSGQKALDAVSLEIEEGEILALLGPNGAGKTTMISIVCGITRSSGGSVSVGGFDIAHDYRKTRKLIGLVPQEIALEPFARVREAVSFTRGLFGVAPNPDHIEKVLRDLSLWDKRDSRIMQLSGGMKRRVSIAKALSHEPRVLFLDEPTAGVDVELRKSMWDLVHELKADGVTIILTTHYIEEAEAIADRVGVINKGRLLLVEETGKLMRQMGKKHLRIELHQEVGTLPASLAAYDLERADDGHTLVYTYDTSAGRTGITTLLKELSAAGFVLKDLQTRQSSLEEIFVDLVRESP